MLRIFGLDQHFAGSVSSARATCNLHDCLREPFAGAEIRAEKSLIRIQHHHQRHVRKMMALGQHLRTDQDADLVATDLLERVLELAFAPHAVAIDACQRHARKEPFDRLFDAFGSLTDRLHQMRAARTHLCCVLFAPAVMADELARIAMDGEMRIAAPAMRSPAAVGTEQDRRIATTIQEQQNLSAGGEMPLHAGEHWRGNALLLRILAQIDQADGGCTSIGCAMRKGQQTA